MIPSQLMEPRTAWAFSRDLEPHRAEAIAQIGEYAKWTAKGLRCGGSATAVFKQTRYWNDIVCAEGEAAARLLSRDPYNARRMALASAFTAIAMLCTDRRGMAPHLMLALRIDRPITTYSFSLTGKRRGFATVSLTRLALNPNPPKAL